MPRPSRALVAALVLASPLAGSLPPPLRAAQEGSPPASPAPVLAVLRDLSLAAPAEPWSALREGLLTEVFGCPIAVTAHPIRGCPLVLPLPQDGPNTVGGGGRLA